jgi:hypothetical protein
MLTRGIGVSFSTSKTQGGFPQTLPLSTLKAFGVGDDLPYSATASAMAEQRWVEFLFFNEFSFFRNNCGSTSTINASCGYSSGS